MQRLRLLLLPVALLCAWATPASASLTSFSGTLSVRIGDTPVVFAPGAGVGTVTVAGGNIDTLVIPANAFATVATQPIANRFPLVQQIVSFTNGPISIALGGTCTAGHPNVGCPGGGRAGFGGLAGQILLGVFNTTMHVAGSSVTTGTAPALNLTVPLSPVGGGSTAKANATGIVVTVSGAGWTTGTVSVRNPTATVMVAIGHNPGIPTPGDASGIFSTTQTGTTATFMGSRQGPGDVGPITLVSPVQIFNGATLEFVPGIARLSLQLVPEPASLILAGGGIAALLAYRRRRTRRG